MVWFKYLKSNQNPGTTIPNVNYSYPYIKRKLTKFTPKDKILPSTWLFVRADNLNLDSYINNTLDKTVDPSSYIVVYEHETNEDDFTPVKTVIHNNILYFQTAATHDAGIEIEKQYSIYYKTPNIRYLKSVNNGGVNNYQVTTAQESLFDASYSEVDLESFDVNLNSTSFYNFSFSDGWENGLSTQQSSKVFFTFSGPRIYIYGSKGPGYGKFKLRILGIPNTEYPTNSTDVNWIEVDCYQSQNQDNILLYSKTDLSYRDYNVELQVANSKNILSTSNSIKISSYSFMYNAYIEFESELLTENTAYVKIGGIR